MITIYDVSIDDDRPITQSDVDRLMRVQHAYGQLRLMMMKLLDETTSLINNDDKPKPLLGAFRTFTQETFEQRPE